MSTVLITQRIVLESSSGEVRDTLDVKWFEFLRTIDLIPIPLPSSATPNLYFDAFEPVGVILSGGNDLSSVIDNPLNARRDALERKVLDGAVLRKLPVLGVCRGMQFIAHYFGGSVVKVDGHVGAKHSIVACGDERFRLGLTDRSGVNSFHNYAVRGHLNELETIARSDDGVVEAVAHKSHPILGIMWHPERNSPFEGEDQRLLDNMFRQVRELS